MFSENYLKKHALHAAFIVAKHDVVPMDLVAIDTSSGQRLYSFLSVGWGLMSDVDIESERYRSMGNARFTLMAIVKIASLYTLLYKILLKSISITNNKLNFKIAFQILFWVTLESSTKYKTHLAKVIKIQNTFNCTYAKTF